MRFRHLGKYHQWTGNITRGILENLTEEEFSQNLGSLIGSIRDKVIHILLALETMTGHLTKNWNSVKTAAERLQAMSCQELLDHWAQKDQEIAIGLEKEIDKVVSIQRADGSTFTMNIDDFISSMFCILSTIEGS
ncbi:MAG: DinB family protein [Candidatus Hodarchaeota archaeon]